MPFVGCCALVYFWTLRFSRIGDFWTLRLGFFGNLDLRIILLISPETWRKQYKPLYKRFFDKVHTAGKFVFMHSDGYILELYDDLIEIGVDAINSQVWCMGLDKVAEKCNGRITNWGEICRQHILPEGSVEDVIDAVHKMKEALWVNGGLIGQFEAGPDMPLENIKAGLIHWND